MITHYQFTLGYTESHKDLTLSYRHGAYCINGFRDGKHVAEGYRTLSTARKALYG